MNHKKAYLPKIFVAIQFISIALFLYSGPVFARDLYLLLIELAGVAFGLWAIYAQGIRNFNITPTPKEGASFIHQGPYRIIRHPMYLSILITLLPLLIDYFTWIRLGIMLILIFDLVAKLVYEEINLRKQFPQYEEYRRKSWRLVPGVF